jgi:hypothetical protein
VRRAVSDRYLPPPPLRARVDLLRRSGRAIESTVSGRSMEPAIPSGALIRIAPGSAPPPIGTAVAIVAPGGMVAHRLVARGRLPWNRRFVLTQGDGSRFCDPPVPAEAILGTVTAWRKAHAWHPVPPPAATARAAGGRATLWRWVVRVGFAIHPRLATALVRASLRGRVPDVAWPV